MLKNITEQLGNLVKKQEELEVKVEKITTYVDCKE